MHRYLNVLLHQTMTLGHHLTQVQEEAHQQPIGGGPLLSMERQCSLHSGHK